eukprot:s742_g6.t1
MQLEAKERVRQKVQEQDQQGHFVMRPSFPSAGLVAGVMWRQGLRVTRHAKPFDTCCRGCALGQGHDALCGRIDPSKEMRTGE